MNRKQEICLWIGISVIVLMGLVPPVERSPRYLAGDSTPKTYKLVAYDFIFDTRRPVVLSNLIVQWTIVGVIAGGLIYSFKDKKPKDEQKQ